MSAWLCSDGMISDLAYHINLKCAPDGSGALPRGVDALARLMRDMNEDALVARYGDEKTIFAPFVYNPVHTVMGDAMRSRVCGVFSTSARRATCRKRTHLARLNPSRMRSPMRSCAGYRNMTTPRGAGERAERWSHSTTSLMATSSPFATNRRCAAAKWASRAIAAWMTTPSKPSAACVGR